MKLSVTAAAPRKDLIIALGVLALMTALCGPAKADDLKYAPEFVQRSVLITGAVMAAPISAVTGGFDGAKAGATSASKDEFGALTFIPKTLAGGISGALYGLALGPSMYIKENE